MLRESLGGHHVNKPVKRARAACLVVSQGPGLQLKGAVAIYSVWNRPYFVILPQQSSLGIAEDGWHGVLPSLCTYDRR
jgi:hypothetical protein